MIRIAVRKLLLNNYKNNDLLNSTIWRYLEIFKAKKVILICPEEFFLMLGKIELPWGLSAYNSARLSKAWPGQLI